MRIEIPALPPKECSPNWRGHWAARASATKTFRTIACVSAFKDSNFSRPHYSKALVSIVLVIPDKRYLRDGDNLIASLKPAFDGLIDASIIQNDDPEHFSLNMPIVYEIDKARSPMTILEITQLPV